MTEFTFTIEPTDNTLRGWDTSLPTMRERIAKGQIEHPEYCIKRSDGFVYTTGTEDYCESKLDEAIANHGVKPGLKGINGVFG